MNVDVLKIENLLQLKKNEESESNCSYDAKKLLANLIDITHSPSFTFFLGEKILKNSKVKLCLNACCETKWNFVIFLYFGKNKKSINNN